MNAKSLRMESETKTKPAAVSCGLLLVALVSFLRMAGAQTPEFRAAWADVFHVGMGSQGEVDAMVSTLVSGHYNAVVVQVLGYMDRNGTASHGAHWQSQILPWSTRVTSSFDPLAYLCTQAHANGIEVHAWLGGSGAAMYRVSTAWPPAGNTTLANHPQWFIAPLANSEGGAPVLIDSMYALDMGSPDAQEYIVSIVKELVTKYPIDGINWDDELNGAGYTAGFGYPAYSQADYPKSGLARFRINNGLASNYTPSNTDTAWSDYRRRYKNELMARVQAEMQSIKTNPRQPLRHTTAALAYSPVPSSCTFSGSVPYTYFCDWAGMLQNGWVDAVIPQTYSSSTFNTWADRCSSCWQYNRQIFPGIGAYLNTDATIASEITYTRSKGMKGNCIYSYAVPNSAGNSDWWAYAAAGVYPDVVPTPSMPWRNPATATEGIIWGRVVDGNTGLYVDDATVTVTGGPTVKTDGNGYYVATLVPATAGGTAHSTTVSKSGMAPQIVNAIALAGDIVRYDLTLNASTGPVITSQPQSQTVNQGANASFTVTATGSGTLTYQWRFYGTNLAGATGTSYTRTAAQPVHEGPYTVVVANLVGSVTSATANLTVIVPPTITTAPVSQTVTQNLSATFTAAASGTAPLSFQWQFNGGNISGATGTSYTKANVQPGDAGTYSVAVTNGAGTASASATLTVQPVPTPPGIASQPQSQTVIAGQTATLSVSATGSVPLSYQWWFNGGPIGGATGSSFIRAPAQTGDAGTYFVVVTNNYGAITSASASLTANFSLTATAGTGGTVSKSPDQTSYAPNSSVTLTATPNSGFAFSGWTGDATGSSNPLSVLMTANKAITATFVSTVTEYVVDNTDAAWSNTSPSGSWNAGSNPSVPKIGANYLYYAGTGGSSITRSCRWTPTLLAAGYYDVYVYYQLGQNRTAGATYRVTYNGGTVSSLQNQYSSTPNVAGWFQIGASLPFAAGTSGYVSLGNDAVDTALVSADAAKFVYVGPIMTASTTTLGASANPSVYGDSVTLTATVTGSGGTPTGTVTFKDGGITLGTATLSGGGQATFIANRLSAIGAPRSLTAVYGGDGNFSSSTSSALSQGVTQKALAVTGLTAQNKTYDATTAATLTGTPALSGVLGTDAVSLTGTAVGTFSSKTIGTGKTVNVTGLLLTGADSGNYTLTAPTPSANITAASLAVTGLTAQNKTYDATTAATLTGTPALSGILGTDAVSLTGTAVGTFADANVGTGKTVSISGLGLAGADAGNYSLTAATGTADVTGASTATGLISSINPSCPGTNVTFTATVGSEAGTPEGNVVFLAGGVPFSTNGLVSGVATASTAGLPLGTNEMRADYVGQGNHLASSGSVDQVVNVVSLCSQTNAVLSMVNNMDGTFTLSFVGTPQTDYYVVASPDWAAPLNAWLPLAGSTNTVTNASGLWQFTVTNTAQQQFYRGAAVAPCP